MTTRYGHGGWAVAALGLAALLGAMTGCNPQARGFVLPPGDADKGRTVFIDMGCNACHHIPEVVERLDVGAHPQVDLQLGGTVASVKTYGELVTAVIHPQLKRERRMQTGAQASPPDVAMRNFNDEMTVGELIDLVAFLQGTYTLYVPD